MVDGYDRPLTAKELEIENQRRAENLDRRNEILGQLTIGGESVATRGQAALEARTDAAVNRRESRPVDPLLRPAEETPELHWDRVAIENSRVGGPVGHDNRSACPTAPVGLSYCDGSGHARRHFADVYHKWIWVYMPCPVAVRYVVRQQQDDRDAQQSNSKWRPR